LFSPFLDALNRKNCRTTFSGFMIPLLDFYSKLFPEASTFPTLRDFLIVHFAQK